MLGCMSVALLAGAAPPSPQADVSPREHQVEVAASILDGYAGFYQLGQNAVMTVSRNDKQLATTITGQGTVDFFPESATEFFAKVVKAQISFISDGRGGATALVIHQNGRDTKALRIDAAAAGQINAAVAAKIKSQRPTPGSEEALRHFIAGIESGKPDYAEMSPVLAEATRRQLPNIQADQNKLGAVQSVEFRGVGSQGWDMYDVKHEHGVAQWRISLAPGGIIDGAWVTLGP